MGNVHLKHCLRVAWALVDSAPVGNYAVGKPQTVNLAVDLVDAVAWTALSGGTYLPEPFNQVELSSRPSNAIA